MTRHWRKQLTVTMVVAVALAAGSAPTLAAEPLATAWAETDGIEIDLMSVERKGSVVTIKWAVRNEGEAEATVEFQLTGENATTYLVDEESGTKYFVLTDDNGQSLSSPTNKYKQGLLDREIEPGTSVRLWAKFPAPPPEVTSIGVIFGGAEPIEGIEITDK